MFLTKQISICLFQHLFVEKNCPFSFELLCCFCQQSTHCIYMYVCPFWSAAPSICASILMPMSNWVDYCSFSLEGKEWVFQLCSSFARVFWLFKIICIFAFPHKVYHKYKFRISLSFSIFKNHLGLLFELCWTMEHWGKFWHLNNIGFSISPIWHISPFTEVFFHFSY